MQQGQLVVALLRGGAQLAVPVEHLRVILLGKRTLFGQEARVGGQFARGEAFQLPGEDLQSFVVLFLFIESPRPFVKRLLGQLPGGLRVVLRSVGRLFQAT